MTNAASDNVQTASSQRRLVAIAFTDMVGYTALVQRDERLARRLLEAQRHQVRRALAQFAGGEIDVVGDGFLLEFPSALHALQFAVAVQQRLAAGAEGERVALRIGLHLGDVERLGQGVFGDSVNIAARIQSLAPDGGLALSGPLYEQIRSRQAAAFRALGATHLKGLQRPIEVFTLDAAALAALPEPTPMPMPVARRHWRWVLALAAATALAALLWWTPLQREAPAATPSVAVLPFANLSAQADDAYFADGVHDAILTHLARVPGLKVTSRTSVMAYRETDDTNLREIAQRLGVAHIVEGTVQRIDRRVRITAQLIEAGSDRHLWAESFDRELADVFAIQSEVARRIGESVHAELSPAVIAAIEQAPTDDTGAYDFYLRAMDVQRTQAVDSADRYARSRDLLEQAVARDPTFALAHAALANVHITTYWWAFDLDPARRERTRAAAETALRLDPQSAEAHLAYGTYFYYGFRDYERALAEYEIALARQPNSAEILAFISFVKRRQGRWQESLDDLARAMALDPQNPGYVRNQAETLFNLRRYADADRVLEEWLRTHPDDVSIRRYRAYQVKDWRGDLESVAEALGAIPAKVDPDHRMTFDRVQLAAAQGRLREALALLQACDCPWITLPGASRYPKQVWLADLHALLGERDAALAAYRRAVDLIQADLAQRSEDARARAWLGVALAGLEDWEPALAQARLARDSMPPERDALVGPLVRELYARVLLMRGDIESALTELEALAAAPGAGTPYTWRLNPVWRDLYAHPRFVRMLEDHHSGDDAGDRRRHTGS